jgi:FkbM family methyltransferase
MFDEFKWTDVSEKRNELTSAHEPIQIDLIRGLAARCSNAIFLDIGANIGVYSIMLSNEAFFSEIHAFEALKSLSIEIQKNLTLNDLKDRVVVHQVVLSDEAGDVEFIVRSDYAGDGGVRDTHLFSHLPFDRVDKMQRVALDEIVHHRGRNIVAKIDVEGHELKVLQGAQLVLSNNQGFLQIEILQNDLVIEIEYYLKSLGWYYLFRIEEDYYFSNMAGFNSAQKRLELLEGGLKQFVVRSRSGVGKPARKRIMPGVIIEMRRSYVLQIKKLLKWKSQ